MKKKCFIISILVILFLGIIFTNNNKYKVDNDSLAVFVDGERADTFPNKDNYVFVNSNCDNDVSIEWDNDTWSLYAGNLDKKVKCNLYFQEKLVSKVTNLSKIDTTNIATDDPDNNIRYIGANPNNYVYFNCSDYSNQSDSTCEKWRIIGAFNNVTKSDGTKENLVKIIRDESIGHYSWDNKDTTTGAETPYGKNDWTTAKLNYLLNQGHDGEEIGGSLYYNAKKGICYYGQNNATTSCDFTSIGLKNDTTRNSIEKVVWNIGGPKNQENVTASLYYGFERGTTVYSGRQTTWTGKVGLIYLSDYGYATSGGANTNRASCLSQYLFDWNTAEIKDCKNNDYLYDANNTYWTITPLAGDSNDALMVYSNGLGGITYTYGGWNIKPSVYLKSNNSIKSGNGSENNPYQLNL